MQAERERRLWARYRCRGGLICRLEVDDGTRDFEVRDVSRGGMRVVGSGVGALADWSVGEAVRIASARPVRAMLASEEGLFRDIAGHVIWMGGPAERPGMGIAFDAPLPTAMDAMLRLFLESEAGVDREGDSGRNSDAGPGEAPESSGRGGERT